MIYQLYIPQSRIPTSDCILMTELRNLTWVAGGMSSYPVYGTWWEYTEKREAIEHQESSEVREYIVESHKRTAFEAGIQRVVQELQELGEKSVLWTATESEIHFEDKS